MFMKKLLPKLLIFIFALGIFASCQQGTTCPAYGKSYKSGKKPTFLRDRAPRMSNR